MSRDFCYEKGETVSRNYPAVQIRIKNNIKILENECHIWIGSHNKEGRGTIHYRGKTASVPRVIMFLEGKLPSMKSKLLVCHTCNNPQCCNMEHLFIGTNSDNRQTVIRCSTGKTHCPRGHEYTKENTYKHNNTVSCRMCHRLEMRNIQKRGIRGRRNICVS